MGLLLPFVYDKHSLSQTSKKEKYAPKVVRQNDGILLYTNGQFMWKTTLKKHEKVS